MTANNEQCFTTSYYILENGIYERRLSDQYSDVPGKLILIKLHVKDGSNREVNLLKGIERDKNNNPKFRVGIIETDFPGYFMGTFYRLNKDERFGDFAVFNYSLHKDFLMVAFFQVGVRITQQQKLAWCHSEMPRIETEMRDRIDSYFKEIEDDKVRLRQQREIEYQQMLDKLRNTEHKPNED